MISSRVAAATTAFAAVLAVGSAPALGGLSPVIGTITPSSGTTAGGTVVTITGSLLNNCGGYLGVLFGGVAGTQVQSISGNEMRVTTPAFGTPGPVSVEVRCMMSSTRPNGFTYVTPPPDPTPDPTPGPAPGPAPVPTPTSTSTPAPGAVTPAPVIASITPGGASAAGGQVVAVTGSHLTGTSEVAFSGPRGTFPARSFTVESGERMIVAVPALAAGAWTVSITTAGGTAARTGFIVVAQPSATGPGGGTPVASTSSGGSGTFATWLRVGAGVESIGAQPRYTVGGVAASRESGALRGVACTRSSVIGTPPRVRITCPLSPALRVALADGSARVSIRMTARVKGSTLVVPLRPVTVTVLRPVRRLAVTG